MTMAHEVETSTFFVVRYECTIQSYRNVSEELRVSELSLIYYEVDLSGMCMDIILAR